VTILLSGGLGLLKLDAFWIGMKEGLLAAAIGVSFPLSHYFGRPLIKALVMQPHLLNMKTLEASLVGEGKRAAFDEALFRASCGMGAGTGYRWEKGSRCCDIQFIRRGGFHSASRSGPFRPGILQ
jgi:hypothetical protein